MEDKKDIIIGVLAIAFGIAVFFYYKTKKMSDLRLKALGDVVKVAGEQVSINPSLYEGTGLTVKEGN